MSETKTVSVKLADLSMAFDFVSASPHDECKAFISIETGEIVCASDLGGLDEEIPDDLDDEDCYIPVPGRRDFNMGSRLALAFVAHERADDVQKVSDFFRRRGAYPRFKSWLHGHGLTQRWYDFEQQETEAALRAWCEDNEIEILDG